MPSFLATQVWRAVGDADGLPERLGLVDRAEHVVRDIGLREGDVPAKSVALQLVRWTRVIPAEFREQAEEIVVAAARAGADLRALAAICAEIRYRTAPPDPRDEDDRHLDRGLCLDTTLEGAGVIRGDLTPQCTAMVTAVLDALSAPHGRGDLRTRPQRYHDALAEAMPALVRSRTAWACGSSAAQAGQVLGRAVAGGTAASVNMAAACRHWPATSAAARSKATPWTSRCISTNPASAAVISEKRAARRSHQRTPRVTQERPEHDGHLWRQVGGEAGIG